MPAESTLVLISRSQNKVQVIDLRDRKCTITAGAIMERTIAEEIKYHHEKIRELQETCTHQFSLTRLTNLTRFDANESLDAQCATCTKQIIFSPWNYCPQCFNNLSEVGASCVPGKYLGGCPVDDGQNYDYPTLEKQCTCGVTVWKYKT